MWQATHWLPALLSLWCVCSSIVAVRGPFGDEGPHNLGAEGIGGLPQLRVVRRAVNVVAIETGDAAPIHHALHKVIALHPVFVGGAVREIKKILRFSKRVIFQLPIVRELQSDVIADGPIAIFSFDWV